MTLALRHPQQPFDGQCSVALWNWSPGAFLALFFIFSQTGSGGFHLDPGKPISLEMIRVSIACDPCYWRSQNLFDTVATCGDDS
jgi:hypothetical protein